MEIVRDEVVAGAGAACECAQCQEYGGPNPAIMSVRLFFLAAQSIVAVLGLAKERSWRHLGVLLGAIAFFLSVPRYLICCRCESYGEKCYSLYLGKLTSMYLPRVEGREISRVGAALEALTLQTIALTPAVGLRRNRRLFFLYAALANTTLALHFWHACRHCAEYATDWRKDCPAAEVARRVFSIE